MCNWISITNRFNSIRMRLNGFSYDPVKWRCLWIKLCSLLLLHLVRIESILTIFLLFSFRIWSVHVQMCEWASANRPVIPCRSLRTHTHSHIDLTFGATECTSVCVVAVPMGANETHWNLNNLMENWQTANSPWHFVYIAILTVGVRLQWCEHFQQDIFALFLSFHCDARTLATGVKYLLNLSKIEIGLANRTVEIAYHHLYSTQYFRYSSYAFVLWFGASWQFDFVALTCSLSKVHFFVFKSKIRDKRVGE